MVADTHNILVRWRNRVSQLLKTHGVTGVRETEIHTAEPLMLDPNAFEVEVVIEKQKDPDHQVLIKFQQT